MRKNRNFGHINMFDLYDCKGKSAQTVQPENYLQLPHPVRAVAAVLLGLPELTDHAGDVLV